LKLFKNTGEKTPVIFHNSNNLRESQTLFHDKREVKSLQIKFCFNSRHQKFPPVLPSSSTNFNGQSQVK
jgi:hypothetical protein